MRITLLQTNIVWRDAEANRTTIERLVAVGEKSDLYVLPEMFTTGFDVNPQNEVEAEEGETLQWMRRMAEAADAAFAGSVAVRTVDGSLRNRMYFVKPDATYVYYDKRHLFAYGGEDKTYTRGDKKVVVEWRGVRFLLQICYDLRFPVFARNGVTKSAYTGNLESLYDCCIYVANWPASRRLVWDALLRARALENQCFVVGVNRVGDDPLCHYNGGTIAIDSYGHDMAVAQDDTADVLTVTLDMDKLITFRKKFPVLLDADSCC